MGRVAIALAAALAVSLLATGCSTRPPARVEVEDAAATASAPGRSEGAAYLTLRNDGGQDDALRAISVDGAASASVHDNIMADGVMRMTPVRELEVPAGSTVAMAPGGLHIMLTGLKAPLRVGDRLTATLRFRRTAPTRINIPVLSLPSLEAARGRH